MRKRAASRIMVIAAMAAVITTVIRALRGPAAPAFSTPAATQGVLSPTGTSTDPSNDPSRTAPHRPDRHRQDGPDPAPTAPEERDVEAAVAPSDTPEDAVAEAATAQEPTVDSRSDPSAEAKPNPPGERWEFPVDGECPPSHPIKAKLRSGIYHLPGMMAYDRARPDRCYATEVDARADGLRRAKR